ncbi:MAG: amidohydrolase family protein [bacterium]
MKQLFKAKYIITNSSRIIKDGAILIENGKIKEIMEDSCDYPQNIVFDFGNSIIMAGFINLHCHLQFTNLNKTKISTNIDFSDWITILIKEYAAFTPEEKMNSFKKGLKQALLSGTTSICNIGRETEFIEILEKIGMTSVYFIEMFSNSMETSKSVFQNFQEIIKTYQSENIKIGASPHSIYNTHKHLWDELNNYCSNNNIPLQTHLAESVDENKWVNHCESGIDKIHDLVGWEEFETQINAKTPIDYLLQLNSPQILKDSLILAHLNQTEFIELKTLDYFDINIAHCPRSNKILHNKTLDLKELLNSDLFKNRIGLGTDSLFSNEDLSIFNEAKYAHNLHNLNFEQFLELLTSNAANILKLNNKIGSLEIGKQADFVIFNLEENQNYTDILKKDAPDFVFLNGQKVIDNGVLTIDI